MMNEMLRYNRKFVEERQYERFQTSKYPDKKLAILTCMDTRLVELLPAALGVKNGDVCPKTWFIVPNSRSEPQQQPGSVL